MTPGDKTGEAAAVEENGIKVDEPKKMTLLEQEIVKKRNNWLKERLSPQALVPIFDFIQKNPETELVVYDEQGPALQKGTLFINRGNISVKIGMMVYTIAPRMNDDRFRLTVESAEKLAEFEVKSDLYKAQVAAIAETRGFIKSQTDAVATKQETVQEGAFGIYLRRILKRRRDSFVAYESRVRSKRDEIEYIFFTCSKQVREMLKEYARLEGMPFFKDKGALEILIYNDPAEDEFVDLLKNFGYGADYCMPARVRIEDEGIKFYPAAGVW